jgi:hypothetical protein
VEDDSRFVGASLTGSVGANLHGLTVRRGL